MSALATIHVGLKSLGIEEEDARDIYQRQTGKRSLRLMDPREHEAVIGELRRLGFKSGPKGRSKGLEGRFAKKLQALWIAGWNLGLVQDRADTALLAFAKRQTGIDHVRFLVDAADARKVVEALKGWLARDGGVQWGTSQGQDFLEHDQGKIAWAQFRLILPGATIMGNRAHLAREVASILGYQNMVGLGSLTPGEWRHVMNEFGKRIRKGKG